MLAKKKGDHKETRTQGRNEEELLREYHSAAKRIPRQPHAATLVFSEKSRSKALRAT